MSNAKIARELCAAEDFNEHNGVYSHPDPCCWCADITAVLDAKTTDNEQWRKAFDQVVDSKAAVVKMLEKSEADVTRLRGVLQVWDDCAHEKCGDHVYPKNHEFECVTIICEDCAARLCNALTPKAEA